MRAEARMARPLEAGGWAAGEIAAYSDFYG